MRSTGTKRKRAEKEALQYPPLVKQGRKEAEGKKRYVPEVFPEVDLPKLVLALEAHRSVVLLFLSSLSVLSIFTDRVRLRFLHHRRQRMCQREHRQALRMLQGQDPLPLLAYADSGGARQAYEQFIPLR